MVLNLLSGATSPTEGTSNKRKKLTIGDVFNQDDEDSADGSKKRKLVPLDYDDDKNDKKQAATAEEKRAKIKHLIENIPTAKEELFAYGLDWSIVDQVRFIAFRNRWFFFFIYESKFWDKN